MSNKSEKSSIKELSEILDSYSNRTPSPVESLGGDSEDEALSSELMQRLTPDGLRRLRKCFKIPKEKERELDRRVEEVMRVAAAEEGIQFAVTNEGDPRWLDERGFVRACCKVMGNDRYSAHAHALFRRVSRGGKARWQRLVQLLCAAGARWGERGEWRDVEQGAVRQMKHCKRETIVKLVSVERPDSFCYVAVSRGGRVGVYSGEMVLLHSYEMFYHRTGTSRRVKNSWITDAVYLPDVQSIVLSASDRSLTFYDVSTLTHTLTHVITGIPNIPTCLCYVSSSSVLCVGTERGEVVRVRFLQPRGGLLPARERGYCCWPELSSPEFAPYVSITTRKAHARTVRRVCSAGQYVISCSQDPETSVRICHLENRIDDYLFKVLRGVTCFHIIWSRRLLVTGGHDVVRLWDSTQSKPSAELSTRHRVMDVAAARGLVVGYCSNCWVYIWDLNEETLLQTLKLKFPFLGVLGKKIEFGTYCIHPGPATKPPTEDPPNLLAPPAPSRRGSSVYRGSTGGLMLQDYEEEDPDFRDLKDDPEYVRSSRGTLLLSCCDYICCVSLVQDSGLPLPPPGDTARPRRPSDWDLPDDVFERPPSPRAPVPQSLAVPSLEEAAAPIHTDAQLDDLLENAGLNDLLKKDFVLMYGLKHDLNRKLADMEANKNAMLSAVSMCAPYLALTISETDGVAPIDEMTERYKRVMKLFPGASVTGSPIGSLGSTPRRRRSDVTASSRHTSTTGLTPTAGSDRQRRPEK